MVNKGRVLHTVHEKGMWGAPQRAWEHFIGVLESFEYHLVFEEGVSMER